MTLRTIPFVFHGDWRGSQIRVREDQAARFEAISQANQRVWDRNHRRDAGGGEQPEPDYAAVVMQDNPAVYFRLGEASGDAQDQMGGPAGTPVYDPARAQPSVLPSGEGASLGVQWGNGITVPFSSALAIGDKPFSLEAWLVQTDPEILNGYVVGAASGNAFGLYVPGVSRNQFACYVGGTWAPHLDLAGNVTRNVAHHVVVTHKDGTSTTYLDGVARSQPITQGSTVNASAINLGFNGGLWAGRLQEVAVYNYALPSDRVLAHYEAGAA